MKKNEFGFGVIGILAILIVLGFTSAVGWTVWSKQKENASKTESRQSGHKAPEMSTLKFVQAPLLVDYDTSWRRLTEYGYPRDGLIKNIDGVDFLVLFTPVIVDYDYMNRAVGGAYPLGNLFKEIQANGKHYYIGVTDDKSVGGAFLSTCAPSQNGACSLAFSYNDTPHKLSYEIIDLHRFRPSASNYKGTAPLDVTSSTDKKAIDEFAAMMSTLRVDSSKAAISR